MLYHHVPHKIRHLFSAAHFTDSLGGFVVHPPCLSVRLPGLQPRLQQIFVEGISQSTLKTGQADLNSFVFMNTGP
jgi:hypothetical protein